MSVPPFLAADPGVADGAAGGRVAVAAGMAVAGAGGLVAVGAAVGVATTVVAVHVGDPARRKAYQVVAALRSSGVAAVLAPAGRSLKCQMRSADTTSARYVLILGERELERGVGTLKALTGDGSAQREVPLDAAAIASALT